MKRTTLLFGSLALESLLGVGYAAYTIPSAGEPSIYDLAQVIQPDRLTDLQNIIQHVEKQTGVEMAVVTLPSLKNQRVNLSQVEPFASELFNQWGVGHKLTNNGLLVLVSMKEGVLRFELGSDFTADDLAPFVEKYDRAIRPLLEQKKYSDGVFAAAMVASQSAIEDISWWRYHLVSLILFGFSLLALGGVIWSVKHAIKEGIWIGAVVFLVCLVLGIIKFDPDQSRPGFGGGQTIGVGVTERFTGKR